MQLTIEVTDGPLAGLRTNLSAGQVAIVGRSGRSDFAIPHDRYLSGRHAIVECSNNGCHIRDLNSTNGTWVNGSRVADAELLDGDMVLAGHTPIRVSIQTNHGPRVSGPRPVSMRTVNLPESPSPAALPDSIQSSITERLNEGHVPFEQGEDPTDHLPLGGNPFKLGDGGRSLPSG
jgi:pSer/pThr/pTyr-binding forkhead associated (FHA) protein